MELKKEQRERVIERIIHDFSDEDLFNKLNLDLYEIFTTELEKKSDAELLNIIIDDLLD